MTDLDNFLAQNTRAAETITPELAERVAPYAQHHAGGLYILLDWTGDLCVKLHDSWGDDEHVVVHAYDPDYDGDRPDGDPLERVEEFTTGREAVERFLSIIDGDDTEEPA